MLTNENSFNAQANENEKVLEEQRPDSGSPMNAVSSSVCSPGTSGVSSAVEREDYEFFDTVQHHLEEEIEMDQACQICHCNDDDNHNRHREGDDSMDASLIATSASSTTASCTRKLVRFHRIEIREYGVTLGDHPGPRAGPPVTIEWQHQAELVVDLDQYERIFSGVGSSAKFRRRKGEELRMPPNVREHMLLASHGGEKGIKEEAAAMLLQQQEQDQQQGVAVGCCSASSVARRIGRGCLLGLISWNERLEEAWQSAVRKFKRWKKRRKGIKPEPAELWIETCIPKEIIFF